MNTYAVTIANSGASDASTLDLVIVAEDRDDVRRSVAGNFGDQVVITDITLRGPVTIEQDGEEAEEAENPGVSVYDLLDRTVTFDDVTPATWDNIPLRALKAQAYTLAGPDATSDPDLYDYARLGMYGTAQDALGPTAKVKDVLALYTMAVVWAERRRAQEFLDDASTVIPVVNEAELANLRAKLVDGD